MNNVYVDNKQNGSQDRTLGYTTNDCAKLRVKTVNYDTLQLIR
jgi:hypothetical protein